MMYLANEIELENGMLSYHLFESDWVGQSPSCRKCIIIVNEVLKQPQRLMILKIYPMNLQTFTMVCPLYFLNRLYDNGIFTMLQIIRFAYSAFNILRNM